MKNTKPIEDQRKTIENQRYIDEDEDIDEDEIRTKLGLDKSKVLKLKGESRENFDLTREATICLILKSR